MVSNIGNTINAMPYASAASGRHHHARPDATEMAGKLFSQLDTKNQGYIEKSDLQAAFDKISSSTGSTGTTAATGSSVDDVFASLDSNSDGKVTKDELTSSLKNMADQLNARFDAARVASGMGGPGGAGGPPRRGDGDGDGDDGGFTKAQLESQLKEVGSTDSKRSALISSVVQNFDKADTDGDGKVSFKEAMAYDQASSSSSTSATSPSTSTTSGTDRSEDVVYKRILELLQAYAGPGAGANATTTASISVRA